MDNFRRKFVEEASDLIDNLEATVLELEDRPTDSSIVQRVFRIMHTLKGNSSMFGFTQIDRFTHQMETIYDQIRSNEREVDSTVLDLTLRSVDHLRSLLRESGQESAEVMEEQEELMRVMSDIIEGRATVLEKKKSLDSKSDGVSAERSQAAVSVSTEPVAEGQYATYYVRYAPVSDIFGNGTNPLYQVDELCALGQALVRTCMDKVPKLEQMDPSFCYTAWEVIIATQKGQNAIDDVFIFVEGDSDLEVQQLSAGNLLTNQDFVSSVQRLWERSEKPVGSEEIRKEIPVQPVEQKVASQSGERRSAAKDMSISSVRVASEKLDELMNLVSELVTTQARLTLFSEESNMPGLTVIAENVQKLSRQLRDIAFSIVLIPIETLITRFHRLVRDLSRSLNKDVRFVTEGTDTEMDKTIIEGLSDPLMHILRNSLDHGIEDAETRIRAGKPAQGTILLRSFYSGTNVMIQVSDDGAGMDPKVIQAKAVERGIVSADRKLSKREILELVFLPGFSTSKVVTEVSGRGVGMDVVKRKIMELRGEVEVDSEIGVGTTITIKLPLTLSIIDGLLVRVHETNYVIPLSSVDKIYAVQHEKVVDQFNDVVVLDGRQVPFFNLRKEFSLPEFPDKMEQVIVVNYEERKVGFVVDLVVGEYQAVLKPLGRHYKNQDMISGATILGDGTVALVMDTNRIISGFSKQGRFAAAGGAQPQVEAKN
ncbi:MAG: chemotaxis protein CheA [Bacteroidia bacterium]|nr:chemotaxis protein CheA [Bacteroidia bacterium]